MDNPEPIEDLIDKLKLETFLLLSIINDCEKRINSVIKNNTK